jgi:hypothetical protein
MLFQSGGSGDQVGQLVVVDRLGKERPLNSNLPFKGYNDPAISPDGKHIVARAGTRMTGA